MLTVILGILKITGLVLAAVLGLILFLLLSVLLVPIRYQAQGSFQETLDAKVKVSWFFRVFSVTAVYKEKLDVCLRIFGIPVKRLREESDTENADEEAAEEKPEKRAESEVQVAEQAQSRVERPEEDGQKSSKKKTETKDGNKRRVHETKNTEQAEGEEVQKKKFGSAGINKFKKFLEMVQDEKNQRMFRLVKSQVFGILHHILPTRMKGSIKFGFDDPFQTGQVLTYVSPFYALYAKHLELIPVFETAVFEGEVQLKGRIRIGTVLAKGVRLLFDKDIRALIRQIREK